MISQLDPNVKDVGNRESWTRPGMSQQWSAVDQTPLRMKWRHSSGALRYFHVYFHNLSSSVFELKPTVACSQIALAPDEEEMMYG